MMSWLFPISGNCFWGLWPLTSLYLGLCTNVCVYIIACTCVYTCACTHKCMCAQSCLILCDLMDCSLPGSSVHGIFQASILQWVAISSSRGASWPRIWTCVSCIAGRFLTTWAMYVSGYVQICVLCMPVYICVFVHICMHLCFLYICVCKCVCVFPVGLE